MSTKQADIEDILGGDAPAKDKPAAKKTAVKKDAKPAKPAKEAKAEKPAKAPAKKTAAEKPAAKAPAKKAAKAEPTEKTKRPPIQYAEGERAEIETKVKRNLKKPINSRELGTKIGVETRKLRPVLYSMAKRELLTLTLEASKVLGMTVSPA